MKLGIVGLPNVGKSTLFNSLTKAGAAEAANYPFCTIEPNVGIVPVPDKRLDVLAEMHHSAKVVHATIEFVDIAGLVKGASKGEGLGNQFLANIREVDAIVHVVRCFDDTNIVHVDGSVDPVRDIETINLELLFSDMEILERRYAKLVKSVKNDKTLVKETELVEKLKKHMEDGNLAKTYEPEDDDEKELLESFNLLTYKPTIYAANVAEDDLADDAASNEYVAKVREFAKQEGSEVFVICAQIEQEIAELEDDEKKEFLEDLGLSESGLDKLITASLNALDGYNTKLLARLIDKSKITVDDNGNIIGFEEAVKAVSDEFPAVIKKEAAKKPFVAINPAQQTSTSQTMNDLIRSHR